MIKRFIIALMVLIVAATNGALYTGTEAAAPAPDTTENTAADSAEIGTQSYKEYTVTIDGKTENLTGYIYATEDSFALDMFEHGYRNIDIYDSQELTENMLLNRVDTGRVIVERIIGIVEDSETGDGRVLNHDYDTYITYKSANIDYAEKTVILTYLLYNPDTFYTDDVLERYDFVLSRNFEN